MNGYSFVLPGYMRAQSIRRRFYMNKFDQQLYKKLSSFDIYEGFDSLSFSFSKVIPLLSFFQKLLHILKIVFNFLLFQNFKIYRMSFIEICWFEKLDTILALLL